MRGLLLVGVAACGARDPSPAPKADTGEACAVTWDGFAKPFVDTWCTPCHSIDVVGVDRRGAPEGVDFETYTKARQWSQLMADAVEATDFPMPPAGGITDEEREALRAWATCGAPGEAAAQTACTDAIEVPGDTDDVSCDGPISIRGSLTLTRPQDLACLCAVSGDVVVTASEGALALPHLARIGGSLVVDGAKLEELSAPELRDVGAVRITNPAGALDLAVERVTGSVEVRGGQLSATWGLPHLASVGGDLVVSEVGGVARLHFPRLEQVGGDLVLQDLSDLEELRTFNDLRGVHGSFAVRRNPALREVQHVYWLTSVGGDLTLSSLPSLELVQAMPLVEQIDGALRLTDLPELGSVVGLSRLTQVGGDLELRQLTELGGLPDFAALQQVGGDLVVLGNPALPQGAVAGLLDALGEDGVQGIVRTDVP